jgi:pyroglutamyl-peptidase
LVDELMKRPRRRTLAVFAALAALAVLRPAAEEPPPPSGAQPVCLLTGFEPFGGAKTNASWEMLKPLEGRVIAGHRIVILQLPVVYDAVAAPLRRAVEAHRPALVICFGVGTEAVAVELLARNGYSAERYKDNRGRLAPRRQLMPGGPAEFGTQLPAAAIIRALRAARIGAGESRDAGGYLCNECFYHLMLLGQQGAAAGIRRRGFVHVPPVGAADPAGGKYTLEKLQAAVRIVIEETVKEARATVSP